MTRGEGWSQTLVHDMLRLGRFGLAGRLTVMYLTVRAGSTASKSS